MAGRGRVTVRLAAGGEVRAHTITFKLSCTLGWERLWGWFGVLWSRTEEGRRKRESLDHPGCSGNYTTLTPADGTMCSLAHHFFLDEHSLYTKRLCCSDDAFVSLKKKIRDFAKVDTQGSWGTWASNWGPVWELSFHFTFY